MSNPEYTLKDSSRYWLLDPAIPDIRFPSAKLVYEINMKFKIPFSYTGTALLSPEGQIYVNNLRNIAGRCLGGGVLASRDLEWIASGKNGNKPGDYVPKRSFLSTSKKPQSELPSEWIAFEYGLLLRAPFGSPLVTPWDHVFSIAKVRSQGTDAHVRIEGDFGGLGETIFAQANQNGINELLKISEVTGVPVFS